MRKAMVGRDGRRAGSLGGMAALSAVVLASAAAAQTQGPESRMSESRGGWGGFEEIVVTAQKREESLHSVPMSIAAASGEALLRRGITAVSDLPRLVPGFTLQEGAFNSTSFTLRGIGFFNSDLSTPPAVTVYVDEAPLPYPAMTKLAAFDLERVEVLKGPQGTLYGQNATGGLVNYISARPTDDFTAGADLTYGRFNRIQLGGFVSGPLSDTVRVRLALQGRRGDPWQQSITRPGDELGRIRELQGRGTLEWTPSERWTSRLTFTFTADRSHSIAAQFVGTDLNAPELAPPGFANFPVINKPRAADWSPVRVDSNTPFPYESDSTLFHATWRNDYELAEAITFTSLTSYADMDMEYGQDTDGTPFHIHEVIDQNGQIRHFFQEFRLAGAMDRFHWLVGANYTHDKVHDEQLDFFRDKDLCNIFTGINPDAYCDKGLLLGDMRVNTYGLFGRGEFNLTESLSVEGALRYNIDRRRFENCAITVTSHFADYWNLFRGMADPLTEVGDCYILDTANNLQPLDMVRERLNDNTLSWRAGLNWSVTPETLLYANLSKGYKAGHVPVVGAATVDQLAPVPAESVLAYEAGVKAGFLDGRMQVNAAGFYYDYKRKQLRGALLDPAFGPLEALVSIPESHAWGGELQVILNPVRGLVIDSATTYVRTEIDSFVGFDAFANFADHSGTAFPFAPKWQSVNNIDYEFPLSDRMTGFVGGSLTYNSKTYSGVGEEERLRIDDFLLVDLRAGVELGDGRYRIWAWGKNITNEYYWNNVFAYGNSVSRYVGQPATYGLSFAYRFK